MSSQPETAAPAVEVPVGSTYSVATLDDWVGRDLGCSEWIRIDQSRIDAFADCTGDHQWIHVDVQRAERESAVGATIAHGYLTLSLLAPLSMQIGAVPADAKAALNYGLDKVRFMSPVKAGASVRVRIQLAKVNPPERGRQLIKLLNTLEIDGQSKPALVAETLVMLVH